MNEPSTDYPDNTKAPAASANEIIYVGFWMRFVASLVDTIVTLVILAPVLYVLAKAGLSEFDSLDLQALMRAREDPAFMYAIELSIALAVVLFWFFKSATPGKMAISAIIVRASDGEAPKAWQLIIRYVGYYISMLPLCLGFIWVGISPRKQGWHDYLAGTVVIKKSNQETQTVASRGA